MAPPASFPSFDKVVRSAAMNGAAAAIDQQVEDALTAGSPLLCWFEECRKDSVPLVGGKCSSLGELISAGVRVPPGFALTTEGYRRFMAEAGIDREVASLLASVDAKDIDALEKISVQIRAVIEAQPFSIEMED